MQVRSNNVTYITLANVIWHYLSVIMDHFSRRVIAWSLSERRDAGFQSPQYIKRLKIEVVQAVLFSIQVKARNILLLRFANVWFVLISTKV